MAIYKFADFVVELCNNYDFLPKQCAAYEYGGNAPADFSVSVTAEEIQQGREAVPEVHFSEGYWESVAAYVNLSYQLPARDAFLLHGSIIDIDGRGIGFLANSGVGKTTHTMLWKQVYGDQMRIINGDKPIVRFFDGVPYAYGTPWAGKEGFQCNDRVELTDLCFIQRSETNQVIPIQPEDCLNAVMEQIIIPSDPQMAIKTLQLLDSLLSHCRIWVIRCNISQEAAILAHNTILGEKNYEAET